MRTSKKRPCEVSTDLLCPLAPDPDRGPQFRIRKEVVVLDIVYVFVAIAVFAVVALVARGVEKL
jgi:hypothetical protein